MEKRLSRRELLRRFIAVTAATALPGLPVLAAADSPAAVSIPFGKLPTDLYIKGPRYLVQFQRDAILRFNEAIALDNVVPFRLLPPPLAS